MIRERAKTNFIQSSNWAGATVSSLAADASARSYDRLSLNGKTAVLMDSPPQPDDGTSTFVQLAEILVGNGFSAPKIFAKDVAQGFLLIEDLGDDLFAKLAASEAEIESTLYRNAIDTLIELQRCEFDWSPGYDASTYRRELSLVTDWYLKELTQTEHSSAALARAFQNAFDRVNRAKPVLVLRDYHAENLLWLPKRNGIKRTGLLDFQDALIGHPAYDLVSLLEDARRDTSEHLHKEMLAYYLSQTNHNTEEFVAAYNLLGAQRNLKIIGIFTRLSKRDLKPKYIDMIPRVYAHLVRDLTHPACEKIALWVAQNLPAPTPDILEILR